MPPAHRPIGYWLKRLDRAIDDAFEQAMDSTHLTRRQWQVLNVLGDQSHLVAEVEQALTPFWQSGADDTTGRAVPVLEQMAAAGLVARDGDDVVTTAEGRARRQRASERVDATRTRLMTGLQPEDYTTVIRLLTRMSENLEASATPTT